MDSLTTIQDKILDIRGQKVIMDRDLAAMYGVENRALNQAVKRNIECFPSDFMFQLDSVEFENNEDVQMQLDNISEVIAELQATHKLITKPRPKIGFDTNCNKD